LPRVERGIVSKRLVALRQKVFEALDLVENLAAPAVKREAEEQWARWSSPL
jgi:hypothetical protein